MLISHLHDVIRWHYVTTTARIFSSTLVWIDREYWESILRGIVVLTYNDDDADDDNDDTMVGEKKNSVSKELGNTFCGSQAISFRYEISR